MKKVILFCALFPLIAGSFVFAGETGAYRTGYVCYDSKGNRRWKAEVEITAVENRGPDVYMIIEKGEGAYGGFREKVSWAEMVEFESNKNGVKPRWMQKKIFDLEGNQIAEESQSFDHTNKKVLYKYETSYPYGKDSMEEELSFDLGIINRLLVGLYIQKLLEGGKAESVVDYIDNKPHIYRTSVRVLGKEKININGHERTAYKLCLDPNLGILNIVKFLLPKMYVWHSAEPNYECLKFIGLEDSPPMPKIEIITTDPDK